MVRLPGGSHPRFLNALSPAGGRAHEPRSPFHDLKRRLGRCGGLSGWTPGTWNELGLRVQLVRLAFSLQNIGIEDCEIQSRLRLLLPEARHKCTTSQSCPCGTSFCPPAARSCRSPTPTRSGLRGLRCKDNWQFESWVAVPLKQVQSLGFALLTC